VEILVIENAFSARVAVGWIEVVIMNKGPHDVSDLSLRTGPELCVGSAAVY
jgi:hypothetical protein